MSPADATPSQLKQMRLDNERYPDHLVEIPRDAWPSNPSADRARERLQIVKLFRSRRFIVQVHKISESMIRLTINRTEVVGTRWKDGVSWDELQLLKRQAGYGDKDAVEVFPADRDVVNVANIRHLWVYLGEKIPFAWRRDLTGQSGP
jgi:hypothetical protein